jgi:hypothetical protein
MPAIESWDLRPLRLSSGVLGPAVKLIATDRSITVDVQLASLGWIPLQHGVHLHPKSWEDAHGSGWNVGIHHLIPNFVLLGKSDLTLRKPAVPLPAFTNHIWPFRVSPTRHAIRCKPGLSRYANCPA